MNDVKHISIEEYDYPLPEERIAKYPLPKRDASNLLVLKDNEIKKSQFNPTRDTLRFSTRPPSIGYPFSTGVT